MKLYIGVTDNDWFRYLADLQPEEVNFWQPSGSVRFRALKAGELFLFKLHSPLNFIVGGGFFISHSFLPLTVAWETFGRKNGTPDYWAFAAKIRRYRMRRGDHSPNPTIGCIVLTCPFFFDETDWLPIPPDWKSNIVSGKTYDLHKPVGAQLWEQVQGVLARQKSNSPVAVEAPIVAEELARYGSEYVAHARLGQGGFRVVVAEAYQRRCAFTGEQTLPALQASHIKPYAVSGPHRVSNGLLLRADLHQLFDRGYMTVTKDFHIEVSKRIKEEFDNGRAYYRLHGQRLSIIPPLPSERPAAEFISYHNEHIFAH